MVPSSELDPCRSPVEEVSNKLKGFVIGDESDLDEFLKKGEISQASQLAITVLKSADEETECGQTLSLDTKTLVGQLTIIQSIASLRSIMDELIILTSSADNWRFFLFVCLFACFLA